MNEKNLRDLLDEINVSVIHKNSRGWLVARCPFAPYLHEFGTDRSPSFFVKVNEEGYSGFNCFTCHAKGNLTKLLTRLGSLRGDNYDSLVLRSLGQEIPDSFADWDDKREAREIQQEIDPLDAELFLRMYPLAWEAKESRAYLKQRGVTRDAAALLDLRFDDEAKRILFPVYDHARRLFGFSGRSIIRDDHRAKSNPKVRDYAGLKKEQCILAEHLIEDDKPILLVEGLFALAHMISIGVREFCNPVASMGSHLSEAQRDILVDRDLPVYLLYDNDAAGDLGLYGDEEDEEDEGAIDKLKPHVPTFVCLYPEEINDPDKLSFDQVRSMVEGDNNERQ